jgi:hypothetical protein
MQKLKIPKKTQDFFLIKMTSFFRLFYQQCSRKHDWGVFGPYQKKIVIKENNLFL